MFLLLIDAKAAVIYAALTNIFSRKNRDFLQGGFTGIPV